MAGLQLARAAMAGARARPRAARVQAAARPRRHDRGSSGAPAPRVAGLQLAHASMAGARAEPPIVDGGASDVTVLLDVRRGGLRRRGRSP